MPALSDHIELIKEAKIEGYTVITCDNNPDNEGHKYSDKSYNISLLDLDKILKMSQYESVYAVLAFSTDIGAIPAALIREKLNLVGNSVSTVNIMTNKGLFREFLRKNKFSTPNFQTVSKFEEIDLDKITFPLIIKPTDRASSKGVCIVTDINDLKVKLDKSLTFSFEQKVIIEDYIEIQENQIHGDALVQDGELIFCCLGDQYFGNGDLEFCPIATTFPTSYSLDLIRKVKEELQRFLNLVDYRNGGLNIEVRITNNMDVYFIEIAPRSGGNFIPKTISLSSNINIIKECFNISIGKKVNIPDYTLNPNILQFILRSEKEGIFRSVSIIENRLVKILEDYPIKKTGDMVNMNTGPNNIISIYILEVYDCSSIQQIINHPYQFFSIKLDL